jgi:small subunit ribosomal protein S16
VKIRLMRVGKKKQPTYRVVVADSRSPRDGRFIEILGQYAPRAEPSVVSIDGDRALAWIEKGAQPTEQVGKLLEISGVWAAYKEAVGKDAASKPKAKTPKAKKVVEKAEPAAAPAPAPAAAPAAEASAAAPADEAAAEVPAAEEPAAEEAAAEPEATDEAPAAEEAPE